MQNGDKNRRSSGMDDTSMTIEFLRARLLAERSVTKSARQRAAELAERVAELEEQLRIVSLQRKKAEKATSEVLAILKINGINDISDSFYSGSDEEESTPRGQKVRGSNSKKVEGSVNSREREDESEKFSENSELEPSSTPGRHLSWKGRDDASRSIEKFKDSSVRRRGSFSSAVSSSSKYRLGKSCRQIKRREQRSRAAELEDDSSLKAGSQENGGEPERGDEMSRADSGSQKEGASFEFDVSGEFEAERDMEKALEHQAQLIGQYEKMENEQREWEEKYHENNSSTVESCDPGNHSDITDEREEVKSQSPHPHSRATAPPLDQEEPTSSPLRHDPTAQKPTPPSSDGPKNPNNPDHNHPSIGPEASRSQTEPFAMVPHQTSDRVVNLLDTLQRAKSLLHKEITRAPSIGFGSSSRDPFPTGGVAIPGGFPGLFRLPTDFSSESNTKDSDFTFFPSSSGPILSSTSNGALLTSDDRRFASARFIESNTSRPTTSLPFLDDRYLANQFMNSAASRIVPPSPRFNSSYPDLAPRLHSNGGGYIPRLEDSNMASRFVPSEHFQFRRDTNGPRTMYR